MTARAGLNAAVTAVQLAACGLLILAPMPAWAAIGLTAVIISGVALTVRQGALPDGGQDFLALRLWDVAMLRLGGVRLGEAWAQCFSEQRGQPPCQEGNQP
jgi:hypothetical protein